MSSLPTAPRIRLPDFVGVAVADSPALLSAAQLVQLGALLLRIAPLDIQAVCFVGGPLAALSTSNGSSRGVRALEGDLRDEPLLVVNGPWGALCLLAAETTGGYATRISTDPDLVDRVVLAVAQLSNYPYISAPTIKEEDQRALVGTLVAAAVADPSLRSVDLAALFPEDARIVEVAGALRASANQADYLALPPVRKLLVDSGATRALVGPIYDDGLLVLATVGGSAPRLIGCGDWGLGRAIQYIDPAQARGLPAEWGGGTLAAAPLLRDGQLWGALLLQSERPLAQSGRALVAALGVLLAAHLSEEAAPALLAQTTPPPAPAPAAPTAPRGNRNMLLVDAQGRLASCGSAVASLLALADTALGQSLAESDVWFLAPLLTDALLDQLHGPQEVRLPNGEQILVTVEPHANDSWAFCFDIPTPQQEAELASVAVADQPPSSSDRPEAEGIERFLATFANSLHAPLRALRDMVAQLPAAGPLNEQQSRLIGHVSKLNSELMLLVNDLFDVGQMPVQQEGHAPIRLDLLVEAAVGTLYAEFGRRGQQTELIIAPNLPQIVGSEEGLWRAVTALLDNAIKYSPTGAHITVAVEPRRHEVVVAVTDSGIGLAPDELEQVFDPFYRAAGAEQLDVPGRGLGLAIAQAVVDQHGGRIWATSSPEGGSTFAFALPVKTMGQD